MLRSILQTARDSAARPIVESYVLLNPSDAERQMMERDYERHRDQLTRNGVPLALGDLRGFIGASAGAQSTTA